MKKIVRIIGVLIIAILALWPITTVFAVPGDITDMTANPSNTTIILTWIKGSTSNNTMIRYRTDHFPTDNADGVQVYYSTGEQVTVGANVSSDIHVAGDNLTALVAGQAYYFSAWGESSGTWSVTPFHIVMSTLAVAIPSGAQDQPINTLPVPTVPANMNQAPTIGSFQLEPFTSIVNWFNNSPGGLGMPTVYAWETIYMGIIVAGGFLSYIKVRNFFVAYAVLFTLTFFGVVGLHLIQGWLLGIEIVVGMGVWAVEHYLQ